MNDAILLDSRSVAAFAARGFVRLDQVVPAALNERFLAEAGSIDEPPPNSDRQQLMGTLGKLMASSDLPEVIPGTAIDDAYPIGTALGDIVRLPRVRGAIESLVGPRSIVDHHFLHVAYPTHYYDRAGLGQRSQNTHQDSTIDPRLTFDVQLFYFPQAVTQSMGGTRFVPGTHLRIVSEAAIGRYQNIVGQQHVVCEAGTIIAMHHGIWHGGGINTTEIPRYMFKIRLNPTVRQRRLWDTSDLTDADFEQRPIFFRKTRADPTDIASILVAPEPWFELDTGRIEYINRIRFWRFLLGDDTFDADYWVSRIENEPAATES